MSDLANYIQSYFGVNEKEIALIEAMFNETHIKKGDYFLQSGSVCNKLSFVQTGLMRIFVTIDDKEVTQWISTKGYFVVDLASLVFSTPARWTIQALTDATLYTISRDNYNKIGEVVPKWHELEKLFLAKCFITLEDRIFTHLSMSAEERYQHFFEHNKELFNQVPLQYIASMLGMTPETFSRVRKKMLNS